MFDGYDRDPALMLVHPVGHAAVTAASAVQPLEA